MPQKKKTVHGFTRTQKTMKNNDLSPIKSVFLDRDGVINRDHGYVGSLDRLELFEDTAHALASLKKHHYKLFVITNQSGIARGLFTLENAKQVNTEINRRLAQEAGIEIDGFYICPHHPDAKGSQFATVCSCRKPNTGLIEQAIADHPQIDREQSFLIGDKSSDIECGLRAGLRTIQILHGQYEEDDRAWKRSSSLDQACQIILNTASIESKT